MRGLPGNRLVIATHNPGKVAEFAELLDGRGLSLVGAAGLGLPAPDESLPTFSGNALLKARAACRAAGLAALADDSGLCIAALDDRPGVRTAAFAERHGRRDYPRAMSDLIGLLRDRGAPAPWRARFVCALALCFPDGRETVVEGDLHGCLTWPMRGDSGHGYDPFFVPDGQTLTLAEMTLPQKNRLSHRKAAMDRLLDACFT